MVFELGSTNLIAIVSCSVLEHYVTSSAKIVKNEDILTSESISSLTALRIVEINSFRHTSCIFIEDDWLTLYLCQP